MTSSLSRPARIASAAVVLALLAAPAAGQSPLPVAMQLAAQLRTKAVDAVSEVFRTQV